MKIESAFNVEFFEEIVWLLRTTETEVGRRAGLSSGLISRIRTGVANNPTQKTLDQIASALLAMAIERGLISEDQTIEPDMGRHIESAVGLRTNLTIVKIIDEL